MKQQPTALLAFAALLLPACVSVDTSVTSAPPEVTHFAGTPLAGANLPFSKAVRVGNTLYLSGELGIDTETNALVPGGTGPQTAQIFENYERTLAEFDADLSDLVKCTVFLGSMDHYGEMNTAYRSALPEPLPARSTVGVNGLGFGAALEIECIAVLRE